MTITSTGITDGNGHGVAFKDGAAGAFATVVLDAAGNVPVTLQGTGAAASPALLRNLNATPQTVSASPCRLYALTASNGSGAAAWLQVFDAAAGSIVPGTTAPVCELLVGAGATQAVEFGPAGARFATAINIIATTAELGSAGSAAGVTAAAVWG